MKTNQNKQLKNPSTNRIQSFIIRNGRITQAQQKALLNLSHLYTIPYQENILDFNQTFGSANTKNIIEIGFGMGDATWQIAQTMPEINFLAIDVHTPGVGALLMKIAQLELSNIRIIKHDAYLVLEKMIAEHSIDGFHIYFPDPWPKRRHHKRRLINEQFSRLLTSKLKVGAYIHIATDCSDYAQSILQIMQHNPNLRNMINDEDSYTKQQLLRPVTKFAKRATQIYDIILQTI